MSRIFIVNTCDDCPNYIPSEGNIGRTREWCRVLNKSIVFDRKTDNHSIPDDCPLEKYNNT